MHLEVGKVYQTRNGEQVGIIHEMTPTTSKNFVKMSEVETQFVGTYGSRKRLEVFNRDGSYVKPAIQHPLDIVSELQ